jgi:hypothetical protein
METLTEYLQNKVDKTKVADGLRINTAVELLKQDTSGGTLEEYLQIAIQTIILGFSRSDVAGFTKLTSTSTKIGERILEKMDKPAERFDHRVRLGDFFIEALHIGGYVSVHKDPAFNEKSRSAPYVIEMMESWEDLAGLPTIKNKADLRGTLLESPPPINKGSLKRTKISKEDWSKVKESAHMRAGDKLQQTGYRVNLELLRIIEENSHLFRSEEKISIPKEGNKAQMDRAYSVMRFEANRSKGKGKKLEALTKQYEKSAKLWNLKLQELKKRSRRTEFNQTLKKAQLLACEPIFYQLVELDYRGRFYFVEPFFNYQAADVAKGLLEFANGNPMGATGERALAIHTASSYNMSYDINDLPDWCEQDYKTYLESEGLDSISVDKMTLDDRAKWTSKNIDLILRQAISKEINMNAEKPVVFMACCLEWHNIYKDPNHISYLPIPVDGSNNGWQHLGAMSRDIKTGELVGMVPSVIQKDFYVQTGKELVTQMPEWFKDRNIPMKHIRKGISKRGSMTRAYSAGEKTMGINMYADCWQEGFTDKYRISVDDCNKLAHNLISSINTVCPGPLETMSYLQKLAAYEIGYYSWFKDGKIADRKHSEIKKKIKKLNMDHSGNKNELEKLYLELKEFERVLVSGNGKDFIEWNTPSGFHVVYHKYLQRSFQCKGSIATVGRISHRFVEDTENPDIRGYMSGVSPNFVHGQDASHMALTVDQWEYDFAPVHDSFSTHACFVEDLLKLTKQTFIEMYDHPNYYDIIEKAVLSNTEGVTIEQPLIGDLVIGDIINSDYFFA